MKSFCNSEADATELRENIEDMDPVILLGKADGSTQETRRFSVRNWRRFNRTHHLYCLKQLKLTLANVQDPSCWTTTMMCGYSVSLCM